MMISERGLALLKQCEGFRAHVYPDIVGIPTIGYGHKLKEGESFPDGISSDVAENLLREDIAWAENAVVKLTKVPLKQGQFDALVDFTFNLGYGSLEHSTLLARLNEGDYECVPGQLEEWDHAGHVEVEALKRRRQSEAALFTSADPELQKTL